MAQNVNIYGFFDFMHQIDHYIVFWGLKSKKMTFFGENPNFLVFFQKSH